MLGAPAVTVKLQLLPDLRIEIRRGDIKYKSVVNLDPEAAGISENERAKIFAAFTGRRLSLLKKLSPAKQAKAIIIFALCDKTGGESALEALLATKLATYEAKQAKAIIIFALCDKTGGESALEALLATKLATYEFDRNGDLTTVVRSLWLEHFALAGALAQ